MESRKTLLSLRWLSSSESLARIVGGQLGGGRRLAVCALLLCLGFHFSLFTAHAQGPGLYKDGKKILDLGEMVDSSFQPAAAPRLEQTAGMKLFREVFGEKMPSKDTPQKKYIRLVLECRDIVESIASYRDSDSAFMDGIGRLLVLEQRLFQANKLLLDKFSEIEKSLKDNGYPAEKIDRHVEVVEGHTIVANRLSELLANLRSAHDSNDQAFLEFLIQELKQYFIDNVFRKDPPLLSSQPLPVMMEVKKAPIVEDQLPPAIPYPTISKDGPDPADLDPTIDVQFTDEIIALAVSLNNSPVEMYNYVRDNFEFEPYLGSRKGSQQTLTHRRGNDYDQASLLIALLRVSGIPARYATGTVKMTIDQATNWLGIQDKRNAGSILTTCGMEGIIYIVNDDTVAISCRRVWVEAWIPFINYRGAINDSTGFMWVPVDPTFKQYEYTPGINLLAEIDFDAEAFVFDYISTFHSETPIEMFREMLLDSLALYHPGADDEDLITSRTVIKETDGILPGTLPYTLMSMDSTFSEIASNKRYYIEFHLYDGSGMDLDYTISLPEIAERQVTISYVGATAAHQEIIDTSGGIFNVDLPYLVDLKPVLKIDGCEVARGSGDVMMGTTHYSDMHFTAPTGASNQIPTVSNVIIAGNYQGIGIDTEDAFPSFWDLPETSCDEEYLGQEVHQTALTYLNNVDVAGDELSDLMHQVVTNDVSEAIVGNTITVLFSGGSPISFEWTGMIVDADRKIIGPFSVDGVDSRCDYMRLGGADGSIQENVLFETRFEQEAISAIKILELASDSGITICEITTSIAADCPGIDQPSHVITAINNALAQGHHVIIPERGFTYYLWTGTGWIDIDPATCAAGYIISGGQNGGATVQEWDITYPDLYCIEPSKPITITPVSAKGLYCAESNQKWVFAPQQIKYWGKDKDDNCELLDTKYKQFPVKYTIKYIADKWGPGEYTFRCGSYTTDCGCTMVDTTVTIVKASVAGYVYGESGRKIDNMDNLSNPANVISSGYMKFKATVEPSAVTDNLYYKWSIPGDGGTLTDPEGPGDSHLEVKWDAPDDHEKNITVTFEIKESSSGPTICTKTVRLRTIRPYVVGVRFVSHWGEEQPIGDSKDPEYDATEGVNDPACYVKGSWIRVQVDLAGEEDDDAVNNLTKKTTIKVTAEATYGGTSNQFDEGSIDDVNTENWATPDFGTVEIVSDDILPDLVTEYEDFEMHWTFKVVNSSGNWVIAYQEEAGYSHKTVHKNATGGRIYGFYLIYEEHEFPDWANFRRLTLDYACNWAKGQNQIDPILQALLDSVEAHYRYTVGGNCWYLSKEFDHLCKCLGIYSKLHKWSADPGAPEVEDMVTMYPNQFEPIGPLTWPEWQTGLGDGSSPLHGWGYHEWVEANGSIYDPSAGVKQSGTWGNYETSCFDHYGKLKTVSPDTYEIQDNQPGQSVGCEAEGHRLHIDDDGWPSYAPGFTGPPHGY